VQSIIDKCPLLPIKMVIDYYWR